MNIYQLLEKHNLKYEDLNAAERETLDQWRKGLETNQLTVEGIKDHVAGLIEAVQKDLMELKESTSLWTALFGWKRDFYLKARLKNYIMLYDFLSAPDKARKYLEQSLNQLTK